jgi:hypothetical protein
MSILGVVFNIYSARKMESELFPRLQGLPGPVLGSLSGILETARSDPHSMFNMLLSPVALGMIPADVRQILLPPLKYVLAESLQVVFFGAMLVTIVGAFLSLLMGKLTGIEQKSGKPPAEQAGATLLAEGIAAEVELAAEVVPDLVEEELSKEE